LLSFGSGSTALGLTLIGVNDGLYSGTSGLLSFKVLIPLVLLESMDSI
jgi:hypothetical protein